MTFLAARRSPAVREFMNDGHSIRLEHNDTATWEAKNDTISLSNMHRFQESTWFRVNMQTSVNQNNLPNQVQCTPGAPWHSFCRGHRLNENGK